jgi:hypothetical protein
MRSDPDVVTAATRSADLLRKGRALLLSLVDHAAARPAWTARVNTVTARTDPVDVGALVIRPNGCVAQDVLTEHDLEVTVLVRAPGTRLGQPA